ncbi:unnamed protein product [Oikopleura dioica]|uniref:Uncharacterized protein n=1 Tax=Oikopleura dioica TaxID=34765 RepID=E4X093_OIKDI|nr:unnamed protein product [Oikopleura dioica]
MIKSKDKRPHTLNPDELRVAAVRFRDRYYNIKREHVGFGEYERRDNLKSNAYIKTFDEIFPRLQRFRRVNYFPHQMKYRKNIADALTAQICCGDNSLEHIWKSRKRMRIKTMTSFLTHAIAGFQDGRKVGLLKNETESTFNFGRHSGAAFRPTPFNQLLFLAFSKNEFESMDFMQAVARDQIKTNLLPSPSSFLLAGHVSLQQQNMEKLDGPAGFLFSQANNTLYADCGSDYKYFILRNGNVIGESKQQKAHYQMEKGDVVVVACSNCQNFLDHEKLNRLTVRIQGPTSVAQFCSAAVSDAAVCIVSYVKQKVYATGQQKREINFICVVAVVTDTDAFNHF